MRAEEGCRDLVQRHRQRSSRGAPLREAHMYTSTRLYFLISSKTSLFFSFYGGSWSFMLSLSIIFACFYACCLGFFLLSIIIVSQPLTPRRGGEGGVIESTQHPGLDREHPGLGAASARRHRAFLRPRGRHGGGERRRLWRVELGAGRRGVGGGVELGLGRGRGLHWGHVP